MLVRDFINKETLNYWAARLGFNRKFAVSVVQLAALEKKIGEVGQETLVKPYLHEEEREVLLGFGNKKRRLEWLGGRLAAKHAAGRLVHGPMEKMVWLDFAVAVTEHGKPYLRSYQNQAANTIPAISISHSGGRAVALAATTPCGIDLQQNVPALLKGMDRYSRASERSLLANCPQLATTDESNRLTLLWSAKEAIRKLVDISPLIGFMDMELVNIEGLPEGRQGVQLEFGCQRDEAFRDNLRVMALLQEDFALALTITST